MASQPSLPRVELLPNWQSALSDAALRALAGPSVYGRGQTYAASGAVQESELSYPESNKRIVMRATVMGTQAYGCEVQVSEEDGLEGDCDCPHSEDGYFCKHQVALALTLRGLLGGDAPAPDPEAKKKVAAAAKRAQTQASNREALKAFVQAQSAPVLAERLWRWAEMDRDLMADLKAWAAQSQASDDPKAMKSVISDLLKSSGFIDWHGSSMYARRAEKVLPLLEKALATDPLQARELCGHALRRLYKAGEQADDSSGEIGNLMYGVMDMLMRSLKASAPPASWLDDWFALMQADPWGLWSEKAVLDAAGPAVQERYSQRVAKDWQAWVASHPLTEADAPGSSKRPGRTAVYVASTLRSYQYDHERGTLRRRYLEDLKRQGDTRAVMDAMCASLLDASEHSHLVAYCEAVGKNREAMQFAQAAYKIYPTDRRTEGDLLRCYERDGWDQEALAIRRKQLEKSPSAEHYQAALKAAKVAGRDPVAYREELYAWAQAQEKQQTVGDSSSPWRRGTPGVSGHHVGIRVSWLLSEGRLDEALTLVQPPHVCDPQLLHTMAGLLPRARNSEALPLLQRVFSFAMPRASTPYREVLDLVAEIIDRMTPSERGPWLAWLRAEYKAKRNFIKGLDALKIKA